MDLIQYLEPIREPPRRRGQSHFAPKTVENWDSPQRFSDRHLGLGKSFRQRRPLTIAEVEAIFEASPDYLKPVWRMFMCTGIRRNELVELRFSDIDFDRRVLTIQASWAKNHKSREIPMNDAILSMLTALRDTARRRKPVAGLTVDQTAKQAQSFSKDHVFVGLTTIEAC